jgi:hypothetical protein
VRVDPTLRPDRPDAALPQLADCVRDLRVEVLGKIEETVVVAELGQDCGSRLSDERSKTGSHAAPNLARDFAGIGVHGNTLETASQEPAIPADDVAARFLDLERVLTLSGRAGLPCLVIEDLDL